MEGWESNVLYVKGECLPTTSYWIVWNAAICERKHTKDVWKRTIKLIPLDMVEDLCWEVPFTSVTNTDS